MIFYLSEEGIRYKACMPSVAVAQSNPISFSSYLHYLLILNLSVPTMNTTSNDGGINFALYRYTPSIAAAIIFAVVFFTITALHGIRLWRNRTYFFIPFIIGLLCKDSLPLPFEKAQTWPAKLIAKIYMSQLSVPVTLLVSSPTSTQKRSVHTSFKPC